MNAKPKSRHALKLAVMAATHPLLDGVGKALLACIAENCSDMGKGARPGRALLCASACLKRSAMLERLQKYCQAGLIERTEVGNGRGRASTYSVCWWHPAYPDASPNGREQYSETVRSDTGNCPVDPPKLSGQAEKLSGLSRTTYPTPSSKTYPNPPQPEAGASAPNPGAAWEGFLGSLAGKGMPCLGKSEQSRLRAMIEGIRVEVGEGTIYQKWCAANVEPIRQATVSLAVERFLGRPKGIAGLERPWAVFFAEAPQLLPIAQEDATRRLFDVSPEGQQALDALAKMNVDHSRPDDYGGRTLAELLAD